MKKNKVIISLIASSIAISTIVTTSIALTSCFGDSKDEQPQTQQPVQPQTQPNNGTTTPIVLNNYNYARAIQFNVNQADAGLIQLSTDNDFVNTKDDNYNILVDVGVPNQSSNTEKQNLVNKYKEQGVKNVDLLVITHFHFDHIGAVSTLLKDKNFMFSNLNVLFNFSEFLYSNNNKTDGFEPDKQLNKLTATTQTMFKNLNKIVGIKYYDSGYWQNQPNFLTINNSQNQEIGSFNVLGVGNTNTNNENDWSVINKFEFNKKSILYTGDMTKKTLDSIPADKKSLLKSDVLKSPHHGSGTNGSNNDEFVKLVSPTEVMISAGNEDSYTLPDTQVLKMYIKYNVTPQNIKGTLPFGKTLAQIKKDNPKNQNETQQDYDKRIQAINAKWKGLNDFITQHPKINNNNKGYGSMLIDFSSTSTELVTSLNQKK